MTEKDKYNIEQWRKEADKALNEGDFWKAATCLSFVYIIEEKHKEKYRMKEKEAIEIVKNFNIDNYLIGNELREAIDIVTELAERYLDLY